MFTGIVTAVGRVARVGRQAGNGKREAEPGLRLHIRAPLRGLKRGESIAVNGVCLTVERVVPGGFTAHAVETTRGRTLLGEYAPGRRVNLERAVRAMDRLGGHIVQGHVDGVGEVVAIRPDSAGGVWLTIRPPEDLVRYLVEKGSVSVDGISLTVAGLDDGTFSVALIPHTLNVTTMRAAQVGDPVNLEMDLIAKYVERLVAGQGAERRAGGQERSNGMNEGAGR